jgi:hypothetical protein
MGHSIREKRKLPNRVRRIKGQVEALKRAVEAKRGCTDARMHGCAVADHQLSRGDDRPVDSRAGGSHQESPRRRTHRRGTGRQRNGTTHRSRPQLFQVETEMSDFRDTAFGARHDHVFLGAAHEANERRTWAVSALAPHRRSQSTQNSGLIGVAAFRDLGWFCFVAGNSALTIPPTVCRGSRPDRLTLHRSNRYKTALQSSMHRAWTA